MGEGVPSLSVVVPTYCRASSLARALDAIVAQLDEKDELIVVDDGSTDRTVEVLSNFVDTRIRVESQSNSGPSAARNRGAQVATNAVLVFIDDDEIVQPGCLAAHRLSHAARSGLAIMGRPILLVPHRGGRRRIPPGPRAADHLITDASFSIARDVFLDVGGFDTSLPGLEDMDLGMRLKDRGVELKVAAGALVLHDIDRPYRVFRRQRIERGYCRAVLRERYGVGRIPEVSLPRIGRIAKWVARRRRWAEGVAAALWCIGRVGGWLGTWRVQSVAAGTCGFILGLRGEAARREGQKLLRT